MIKLLETRIDYLLQSGISNITDKYLNLRFEPEARTEIQLIQVNYHTQSDYLELVFWADSTYTERHTQNETIQPVLDKFGRTPDGKYILIANFYKVKRWIGKYPEMINTNRQRLYYYVKSLLHSCDARFYSDDPSFYWQGVYEDLAQENMSIYKFIGTNGKGIWRDRHFQSGGLAKPTIRVTKHLAQVIMFIDDYINDIVDYMLLIND